MLSKRLNLRGNFADEKLFQKNIPTTYKSPLSLGSSFSDLSGGTCFSPGGYRWAEPLKKSVKDLQGDGSSSILYDLAVSPLYPDPVPARRVALRRPIRILYANRSQLSSCAKNSRRQKSPAATLIYACELRQWKPKAGGQVFNLSIIETS